MRLFFSRNKSSRQFIEIQSITAQGRKPQKFLKPGNKLFVRGKVNNLESYPLFKLQLYGVISRIEPQKKLRRDFGDFLIHDFLVFSNFCLRAGRTKNFYFSIKIPACSKEGLYRVHLNLTQDKRFPVSGIAYFTSDPSWYNQKSAFYFQVRSKSNHTLWIDKNSIKLTSKNQKKIPVLNSRENVASSPFFEVSFFLVNDFHKKQPVLLIFELMSARHDLFSKFFNKNHPVVLEEKISIRARERKKITRRVFTQRSDYLSILSLCAIAPRSKSQAYIKLLFPQSPIPKTFFRWPGLDKFPLKAGAKFNLFSGFSLPPHSLKPGRRPAQKKIKLKITLFDRWNKKIGLLFFNGLTDRKISFIKKSLRAPRDINYLKMIGTIHGSSGILEDKFIRTYDAARLKAPFKKTK